MIGLGSSGSVPQVTLVAELKQTISSPDGQVPLFANGLQFIQHQASPSSHKTSLASWKWSDLLTENKKKQIFVSELQTNSFLVINRTKCTQTRQNFEY